MLVFMEQCSLVINVLIWVAMCLGSLYTLCVITVEWYLATAVGNKLSKQLEVA